MSQRLTRLARTAVYFVFAVTAIASGIWISEQYVVRRKVWVIETAAGTVFPKDLNWQKGKNTLVLAVQQDCRFCSESLKFYQRLVSSAAEAQVRVVVLMPDRPEAARRYISEAGLDVPEVIQVELHSLGIRGTPTIYVVDGSGIIQQEWRGKLTRVREQEVLDLMSNNSRTR